MQKISILPTKWLIRTFLSTSSDRGPIRLLCLAYMNDENASARHRIYKYAHHINKDDIEFHIVPPTSVSAYKELYLPWNRWGHYRYFVLVFFQRFAAIWSSPSFDAVFLQREIISEFFYDPPLFIFALWLLNKRIIYDVDDSIWMLPPHSVRAKSRLLKFLARLRFHWNVSLSKSVIVSNDYLAKHVEKINSSVKVIPTLVDVNNYQVRSHKKREPVIIGWTGGPGNLIYLKLIERPLVRLALKHPIQLRIISSKAINMNGIDVDFVRWNKETEAEQISKVDIGVMPLPDNSYTQGKCGFKLLQYMAAGLPSVVSPIGVNAHIIKDSESGFLAENEQEWEEKLAILIEDVALRKEMGRCAHEFVSEHYDYSVWVQSFVKAICETSQKG